MSRLVIDVSGEQNQQIKALAALQGKTIKEFILEKVFSNSDERLLSTQSGRLSFNVLFLNLEVFWKD